MITPLACAVPGCGVPRRRHDADDHTYQVPEWDTVLTRAAELRKPPVNTCVTCDLPEDRWSPSDPLYLEGGSQCPDCNRFGLNEEATRKHAEEAA